MSEIVAVEKWIFRQNMSKYMHIDELRRQLNSGEFQITESVNCIESGNLINNVGKSVKYEINHGWDVLSANSCDRQWGLFNIKLFEHIEKQGYSEEELSSVLSGIQKHDLHWDWFKKSCFYSGDKYEWFYCRSLIPCRALISILFIF